MSRKVYSFNHWLFIWGHMSMLVVAPGVPGTMSWWRSDSGYTHVLQSLIPLAAEIHYVSGLPLNIMLCVYFLERGC